MRQRMGARARSLFFRNAFLPVPFYFAGRGMSQDPRQSPAVVVAFVGPALLRPTVTDVALHVPPTSRCLRPGFAVSAAGAAEALV